MVCLIRISFLTAFCRCDQVLLEPGHTCQQFASCIYEHIFLHKIISRILIISGVFTPLQKFMHCSPFPLRTLNPSHPSSCWNSHSASCRRHRKPARAPRGSRHPHGRNSSAQTGYPKAHFAEHHPLTLPLVSRASF